MLTFLLKLEGKEERWIAYYDSDAPIESFKSYSLVVLDSDYHPPLRAFREKGIKILGYISLGEVERYRSYFSEVKKEGVLGEENPDWPGSYYVDVRSPLWTKRVIEELIPQILYKRFDGIFLDTLDNPVYLDEKHKGMQKAAVQLVKAIRYHYPDIDIMMNRAYALLPEVGSSITSVLGESVFSDWDFDHKRYVRVPKETYQEQVDLLKKAAKDHPHLKVYTLDYWNPEDAKGRREIYKEQRKNGFIPYVGTIDLKTVIEE